MRKLRAAWAEYRDAPKAVRFHRTRAVVWLVCGIAAAAFGWAESVALVWAASVYANVVSDWGAGEAADNRATEDRLAGMDAKLDELLARVATREP